MRRSFVAIVMFLAIMLTGCASYDANVDQTAIEQQGYILFKDDKELVECYSAGKSGFGGMGNDVFYYPAGQRTYSFTGTSSEAEIDPVPVVTADNQTLRVPGFVKFTLTSSCEDLYEFHQKVGVKYGAYENAGWNNLLNDYLGVAVTNATNDALGTYNWQELYQDTSIRNGVTNELVESMQEQINSALGGDWIKVNSVSISKPIASESLTAGLEESEKQRLANDAQKQANTKILTQYDTIKACLDTGLDKQSCTLIFLSQNGADIPFLPVPQGGAVNYNSNQQ